MNILTILPVLLFFIIILSLLIYKSRANLLKAVGKVVIVTIILIVILNIYNSNRMPVILKASKLYTVNVNEIKSSESTRVKLKKVFMDLNNINFTYSVSGKEKVVAVELKKDLSAVKTLNQITGLWIGGRIIPENSFGAMSYNSDEFISPIYLIFYLSNGESIPFKVTDAAGAGESVRIVNIGKTLDYNGSTLTLGKFYKGLNYSSIDFKANFSPTDEIIDIKLVVNGSELKKGPSGWSGNGRDYTGSFGFDPVNAQNVSIKITNKALNRTDVINLSIN